MLQLAPGVYPGMLGWHLVLATQAWGWGPHRPQNPALTFNLVDSL
jgi:hypothetical protein